MTAQPPIAQALKPMTDEALSDRLGELRKTLNQAQSAFTSELLLGSSLAVAYQLAFHPGDRVQAKSSAKKLMADKPAIPEILALTRERQRRLFSINLQALASVHLRAALDHAEAGLDFCGILANFCNVYGLPTGQISTSEECLALLNRIVATLSGEPKEISDGR